DPVLVPLSLHDALPICWDDVPPVNEALKPLGVEVPLLDGSMRGIATSAKFKQEHPERFEKLVNAYERTLKNEKFLEQLKAQKIRSEEHTSELQSRENLV